MQRVHNFSPGPSVLPEAVLQEAQAELLNYKGCGVSVMEMSHRSAEFQGIMQDAEDAVRRLLAVPEEYCVLFLQGGGCMQFAAVPMNLGGSSAVYAVTGQWSKKAASEAAKYLDAVHLVQDPLDSGTWEVPAGSSFAYWCDNETVDGLETPAGSVPRFVGAQGDPDPVLVADMSSNLFTKTLDIAKYGVIYACAQKTFGIAGATLVIVRSDLLDRSMKITPSVMCYKELAANKSLLNTPATFSVYMCKLFLEWMERQGGVSAMEKRAQDRAERLYSIIDSSKGLYRGLVSQEHQQQWRSRLNIVFSLPSEDLESQFLLQAEERKLMHLRGHRSVGGIRVSLYTGLPEESFLALETFMTEFAQERHVC